MAIRCRWPPEKRLPRSPARCVVAFRQRRNEIVNFSRFRGGHDFFVEGAGAAPARIFSRIVVLKRKLSWNTTAVCVAKRCLRRASQVYAVKQNRAAIGIVEAHQQTEHSALAGSAGSHKRHGFAPRDAQTHVAEVGSAGVITESHVAHFNRGSERGQRNRAGSVGYHAAFHSGFLRCGRCRHWR